MKNIAIIGSSGGNLYRQGGDDPQKLLSEIQTQADSAGINVAFVEFIGAHRSMDGIPDDAPAALWTVEDGRFVHTDDMPLKECNAVAQNSDAELAELINNGKIDGIIMMSCDPERLNNASLKAAAQKKIPAVGTGGTSVANAQKLGVNVISASGTTGTTSRTRAVAFISALAKSGI